MTILLSISSCEENNIEIQEDSILQKKDNSKLTDRQKINQLKANLKYRVKSYNNKFGKNKFIKKYGALDLDNHISFRFKETDNNYMVVIPFKKKSAKNKVLIAYYKEDKQYYKIVAKKRYSSKKEYATSENAFIQNLDVIFNMIYQKPTKEDSSIAYRSGFNCTGIWMYNIPPCHAVYYNSCTNDEFEIDQCGKGGDEGDGNYDSDGNLIDPNDPFGDDTEIIGDSTSYQDIDLGPDNSEPDVDPIEDPIDLNPNGSGDCDEFDFDCETNGGGSNDDQQTDKLKTDKLNTTQKQLLAQALIGLQNNCLGKILYNSVKSVNIEVGQTTSHATYTGISNTIRFNTNNDIDASGLGSELFHAYQQQLYGILDDIEIDPNHVGASNIEFEEKAFNIQMDIEKGTLVEIWPATENLEKWLMNLDIEHNDNNIILNQVELSDWFSALEEFKQYHSGCTKDLYCKPINYNLKPNAIIKLINNLNSINCN